MLSQPGKPKKRALAQKTSLRKPLSWFALATFVVCGGVAACGQPKPDAKDVAAFRELRDVRSASPSVANAARAVVLISTPSGSRGTGSFVSAEGILMTNHHVLSTEDCAAEGCEIKLHFEFQKGAEYQDRKTVLAQPLFADRTLDLSFFQIYETAESSAQLSLSLTDAAADDTRRDFSKFERLLSPSFLEITPQSGEDLLNSQVTYVGHPSAGLKKYDVGRVLSAEGLTAKAQMLSLPGSSGSPVLNSSGSVVGILHSGLRLANAVKRKGVIQETYFTPSAFIAESFEEAKRVQAAGGLEQERLALLGPSEALKAASRFEASQINPQLLLAGSEGEADATTEADSSLLLSEALWAACESSFAAESDLNLSPQLSTLLGDIIPSGTGKDVELKKMSSCLQAIAFVGCDSSWKSCPSSDEAGKMRYRFEQLAALSEEIYKKPSYTWMVSTPLLLLSADSPDLASTAESGISRYVGKIGKMTSEVAFRLVSIGKTESFGQNVFDFVASRQGNFMTETDLSYHVNTISSLIAARQLSVPKGRDWLDEILERDDVSLSNHADAEVLRHYYLAD